MNITELKYIIIDDKPYLQNALVDVQTKQKQKIFDRPATSKENSEALMSLATYYPNKIYYVKTVDLYCYDDLCPVIIGKKLVLLDGQHITGEYGRYISKVLGDRINAFV